MVESKELPGLLFVLFLISYFSHYKGNMCLFQKIWGKQKCAQISPAILPPGDHIVSI